MLAVSHPDGGSARRISGQPAAASERRIALGGLDGRTLACSRVVTAGRTGYGGLGAQPQSVEIAAPYFVASPEQRVQVIGDREMASGQAVAAASGEFEDELRGPVRIGATAGLELSADPAEHA